jgi:formylmethanofuran dehydrogenase subunit E
MGFRRTRPLTEACERCGEPVTYPPGATVPDLILCDDCVTHTRKDPDDDQQ